MNTTTKTISRSHIAAILRHLAPVSIVSAGPTVAVRLKSEAAARAAIDLLIMRGYGAGFGDTALDVIAE